MPIQQVGPFPGEWCDVDYSHSDDAFVHAALRQPGILAIRFIRDGRVVNGPFELPLGRWCLSLRAAVDGHGNVCVVQQDGRPARPDGTFWPALVTILTRDQRWIDVDGAPPAFGEHSVEVVGLDGIGWVVRIATGPTSYQTRPLTAVGTWGQPSTALWSQTSQGFAQIEVPGWERFDTVRAAVPGMVCPNTAAGVFVGQAGPPDRIRGLFQSDYFTVFAGDGFEPHVVVRHAPGVPPQWMVCARSSRGAQLALLEAPFEREVVNPKPPPTPDPPKEEPVPTAPNEFATVQSIHQTNPGLIRRPHEFTNRVAYTLWLGDPRWGHNIKRGNQGLSEDALAYKDPSSRAGGVCIVDIIGAAGSEDPDRPPHPTWLDQTQATIDAGTIGAWSQPVPPAGEEPGPDPRPDPKPPAQSFPLPGDTELIRLSDRLDIKYGSTRERGGLGRGAIQTFVDPLGRARWMHDYFTHRGTVDEAEAWRRVNKAINDIEGLGDLDPTQ